jgi:hypothetical protein
MNARMREREKERASEGQQRRKMQGRKEECIKYSFVPLLTFT